MMLAPALLLSAALAAAASQSEPPPAARPVPPAARPAAIAVAPKSDQAVVKLIRNLEQQWGQAFVKRDFAFIERIIAPEYRLAVAAPDGRVSLTYRDEWMRNSRVFEHQAFAVDVIEVATAGDTAVALAQGLWTVKMRPDRPAQALRFVVTDTWVRRKGRWQVIYRYSHRLPGAPWPPAAK